MADFVATIKVNFELLGLTGAGGGTRQPAGGTGTSGGASVDEIRREFSELASQIRVITTSLKQFQEALSGVRAAPSAAGTTAGGVGASGSDFRRIAAEHLERAFRAGQRAAGGAGASPPRGASGSPGRAAASTDRLEEAARLLITSLSKLTGAIGEAQKEADLLGETHRKASEEARERAKTSKEAAAAAEEAAAAEQKLARARAQLSQGLDLRTDGKLNPIALFSGILTDIGKDQGLRAKAAEARSIIVDLLSIPRGATENAREQIGELRKTIKKTFLEISTGIREGTATPRSIRRAVRAASEQVREVGEQLPPGQRPSFDAEEALRRVAAVAITRSFDAAQKSILQFAEKIDAASGEIDPQEFANARSDIFARISSLESLLTSLARSTFTSRRAGQEGVPGGGDLLRDLSQEVRVRRPPVELSSLQRSVFNEFKEAANDAVRPVQAVSRAVDQLVAGGRGLDNFEDNLRQLLDVFRGLDEVDFGDREAFNRFRDALGLLGRVKVDRAGGVRGPEGAVSREAGIFSARQAVQNLREQLAGRFQQTGQVQRDFLQLNVPTATGGIKKVRVELEALGSTLDQVRVKGREVSDNMFDRTSVRAALQRVATWGAAAGIVFGAVDAFRNALRTLIDTEAAVVGLAKVMDESTKNFEGFKKEVLETGTALAQQFGQPIEGILETLTLFGQQGKTLQEAFKLTEAAALAANVTTLDQTTAASALTAVISQFGKEASDATSIIDKFNEVSNNAAVTETVLSEAILKAGQAASNAGVNLDEFNAIVAAISERTRQTGSEIGTALRFVFSRLQTNEAAAGLQNVGISIRDAEGNVRPFTELIRELSVVFQDLTESQKQQVAIAVSGTRRFNTFLALVENFSQFQDSLADSVNSAGSAFREQERVTETADFRIRQFQNSLKELAISFGDAVLDPLKLVTSALTTFTDILSTIPGSMKVAIAGIGLGTVAFIRLTDQIVDFLGLAGAVKGASTTIGGSIRRNLFTGVPRGLQATLEPDRFLELTGATIAAREVGDLAGLTKVFRGGTEDVRTFAQALASSGKELVSTTGKAVSSTASFTKFGAVVRGLGTRELNAVGTGAAVATLGIRDLNSGLTRFVAAIGLVGNRIARLPILATIFSALDAAAASSVRSISAVGSALGTIGRFALVGGAIFLLVEGFNALREAAFRSGEDIEKALRPELAARSEAIALVEKQRVALGDLVGAQRQLARQTATTTGPLEDLQPLEAERVRRGGFTGAQGSPLLANRRLLEQQREVINSIILSRPELVASIDSFGNASLRSADAFETLADSAANAQRSLFNLTQLRVVEGFAADLRPRTDFLNTIGDFLRDVPLVSRIIPEDFARNIGNQFDEAKAEFEDFLNDPAVREAQQLGIPLDLIDPDAARRGREAAKKFVSDSLDFRALEQVVNDQIAKIQPDADNLVFQLLGRDQRDLFRRQADRLSSEIGEIIDPADILNQRFVQNRRAFQDLGNLIGVTAAESASRFREAGILEEVLSIEDGTERVERALSRLRGGELVVFRDEDQVRQGIVRVFEDGRRQIEGIADDFGNAFTTTFQDALDRGDIRIFDPQRVRQQIDLLRLEVSRIPVGAGRGAILQQDLDLGARSRADLTAQQRTSQIDENLIASFLDLSRQREAQLARTGVSGRVDAEEEAGQRISATFREEIRKINVELDRVGSAIRFREVIEEVAIAFEKAAADIESQRIGDRIRAEFSGIFGAGGRALPAAFQQPRFTDELTGEQGFDLANTELIELLNQLSRGEQAVGEQIAGLVNAQREIDSIFRAFTQAQEPGGVRDPRRLSALQERTAALTAGGLEQAQALNAAIADQQLKEQVETNTLLRQISVQLSDQPGLLGAALAGEITRGALSDVANQRLVAQQVAGADVSQFSTADIRTIAQGLAESRVPLPGNLLEELTRRQADRAASQIASDFLGRSDVAPEFLTDLVRSITSPATRGLREGAPTPVQTRERTAFQQALQETLSEIDLEKVLREGIDGEVVLEGEVVSTAISATINRLLESPLENVRQAAVDLGQSFAANGEEARQLEDIFKRAVATFVAVRERIPSRREEEPGLDLNEQRRQRQSEIDQIIASQRALRDFISPIREAAAAALQFGRATSESAVSLRNSIQSAVDDLRVTEGLTPFTAPQIGLLQGVSVPDVQLDPRRRLSELSGRELTALERPELSRGLTTASAVFESLLSTLEAVRREQLLTTRRRGAFEAEGNVAGVEAADRALSLLGSTASDLERRIIAAQGSFRDLGETFRDLEAINQLRIDIEQLFESFEKERALGFDRTSIETALGRGPFAFARPTFEQFEQGQPGRLTSFERRLRELERPLSGLQSLDDIFGRQRDIRRVQFEQREGIIGFAQERENRQFQAQISAAEQVRERLFDFAAQGGPGSDIARQLVQQLTGELERAGDLLPTTGGPRTIRDPRTGQQVQVPASEVLQFRGVPGLEGVRETVARLAQQFETSRAEEEARFITEPLLGALDTTNDLLRNIKDSFRDVSGASERTNELVSAFRQVSTQFGNIGRALDGEVSPEDQRGVNELLGVLEGFDPNILATVLEANIIKFSDGSVRSLREALGQISQDVDNVGLQDSITSLLDKVSGGIPETTALDELNNLFNIISNMGGESAALSDSASSAAAALDNVASSAQNLDSIISNVARLQNVSASDTPGFASGGLVTGPGGPRDDRVPIRVSPGEFVVNAAAVRRIGADNLDSINRSGGRQIGPDASALGAVAGFQGGGVVSLKDFESGQEEITTLLDIYRKINELERERRDISSRSTSVGGLSSLPALASRSSEIDKELKELNAQRASIQKQQQGRAARIAELRNQGVNITDLGEEGKELLALSARQSEAVAAARQFEKFESAKIRLKKQLQERTSAFFSNVPQELKIAFGALNSAQEHLAPGSEAASEDFGVLAQDLKRSARILGPKISQLRATEKADLILTPPPDFKSVDEGIDIRRQGGVGINFDPLTGNFSPELIGFNVLSNSRIEGLVSNLLEGDLEQTLLNVAEVTKKGENFSSFLARSTAARVESLNNLRADFRGKGPLTGVGDQLIDKLLLGASISTSIVGNAAAGFTGIGERLSDVAVDPEGVVGDVLLAPGRAVEGVGGLFGDIIDNTGKRGGDIADLEIRLEQARSEEEKRRIRREIAAREVELAKPIQEAFGLVTGASVGAVSLGRRGLARARLRGLSPDELFSRLERTNFELGNEFLSRGRRSKLGIEKSALEARIKAARSKEARAAAKADADKLRLQKEVDRLGPEGVDQLISEVRSRRAAQEQAKQTAEQTISQRRGRAESRRDTGNEGTFDVDQIELENRAVSAELSAQEAAAKAEAAGSALGDTDVAAVRRELGETDFGFRPARPAREPVPVPEGIKAVEDLLGLNVANTIRRVAGATIGRFPGVRRAGDFLSRGFTAAERNLPFIGESLTGLRTLASGPTARLLFGGRGSGRIAGAIRGGIGTAVAFGTGGTSLLGTAGLVGLGGLATFLPRILNFLVQRGGGFGGLGRGLSRGAGIAGRGLGAGFTRIGGGIRGAFEGIRGLRRTPAERLQAAAVESRVDPLFQQELLDAPAAVVGGVSRRPIDLLAAAEANRGITPTAGSGRTARTAAILEDIARPPAAPPPVPPRTSRLQALIADLAEESPVRTVDESSIISGVIEDIEVLADAPTGDFTGVLVNRIFGGPRNRVIRPPIGDVPEVSLPVGGPTEEQLAAGRARAAQLEARTAAAARRGIAARETARGPDVLEPQPSVIVGEQAAAPDFSQFPELEAARQRLLDLAEGRISLDEFDPTGTFARDVEAARVQELEGLRRRERERIERENNRAIVASLREEQAGLSGFDRAGSTEGTFVGRRNTPTAPIDITPVGPPTEQVSVNPLFEGRLRQLASQFGLAEDFFLQPSTRSAAESLGIDVSARPQIFGNRLFSEDFTNLSPSARQAVEEVIAAARGPAAFERLLGGRIERAFSPESLRAGIDPQQIARAREALAARLPDIEQARSQGFDEADINQLERQIREEIADRFGLFPDQFASGGKITGPGGPRSDRVPILASNGEFVLNADSVNRIGLPNVELMNRTGRLPRFQAGGLISLEELTRRGVDQSVAEVLGTSDIFSQIRGATDSINATAALKQLSTGNQTVFVNNLTGEEIVASPLAAGELAAQGFSERVDPDLQILGAVSRGGEVFENPQTGQTIVSSGLLAGELRRKGFRPSKKPISQVLSRSALINQDGSISLVSSTTAGLPQVRETPFEKALSRIPADLRDDPNVRRNVLLNTNLDIERRRNPLAFALDDFDEDSVLNRRSGGSIFGPGGPRGDKIPILASNGEFILNSNAVSKIGTPALEMLNSGGSLAGLPKFQDGGLVGRGGNGGTIEISVSNLDSISSAISEAISSVLQEQSVSFDTTTAAQAITDAITTAFSSIELPEIEVNTDNVSVPLEIPAGGIPIDSSSLQLDLGDSLGAAIRDRLEVVEGRSTSNLEEVNNILETLDSVNLDSISAISDDITAINQTADELRESLTSVQASLTDQEGRILRDVDFRISQRLNEQNTENNILARVNQSIQLIQQDITRIDGLVGKAMSMAGRAISFAQARV